MLGRHHVLCSLPSRSHNLVELIRDDVCLRHELEKNLAPLVIVASLYSLPNHLRFSSQYVLQVQTLYIRETQNDLP